MGDFGDDFEPDLDGQIYGDFIFDPASTEGAIFGECGAATVEVATPLHHLIESEGDSEDDAVSDARVETLRMVLMHLVGDAKNPDLTSIGLNVAVTMWHLQMEPFAGMTYEQIGELAGVSRQAVLERRKAQIQKKMDASGARGGSNPRQKAWNLREHYSEVHRGNRYRHNSTAKEALSKCGRVGVKQTITK